jgi:hypothetical protein
MPEPEGNRCTDRLDGSLNAFEVTPRSRPHHTPTLRAAPASQKDLTANAVKKGGDKPMTPDPTTLTPRA